MFPELLITAYADNVILSGPLSVVRAAQDIYQQEMARIGLELNHIESELYIPEWQGVDPSLLRRMSDFRESLDGEGGLHEFIALPNGSLIRLAREGLKVLGCPLGTDTFCRVTVERTAALIEGDLESLKSFPHLHHRIKLAVFCSNKRATYLLRAAKLDVSLAIMKRLDASFDAFIACTLSFVQNYELSTHAIAYGNALKQCRLGIKGGGLGLTSNVMVAPAASYSASCAFSRWLTKWHLPLVALPWLQAHAVKHIPHFGHVQRQIEASLSRLEGSWCIKSSSNPADKCTTVKESACILSVLGNLSAEEKDVPSQQQILKHMKATQRTRFLASLSPDDKFRLNRVSFSTVPSRAASSDIAPPRYNAADTLRQVPMGLFALTCPYELSNEAILTSTALLLGSPVPHALYLRENIAGYEHCDPWGDCLLNKPDHGAASWKLS